MSLFILYHNCVNGSEEMCNKSLKLLFILIFVDIKNAYVGEAKAGRGGGIG